MAAHVWHVQPWHLDQRLQQLPHAPTFTHTSLCTLLSLLTVKQRSRSHLWHVHARHLGKREQQLSPVGHAAGPRQLPLGFYEPLCKGCQQLLAITYSTQGNSNGVSMSCSVPAASSSLPLPAARDERAAWLLRY